MALKLNLLSSYLFQEYQIKCSSAVNDVKIDLLSKKHIFHMKRTHTPTLILRSVQNQKMNVISASYNNAKLCLNTLNFPESKTLRAPPPFLFTRH